MFTRWISQKDIGHNGLTFPYDLVGILPAAMLNDLQNGETA